MMSTETKMQLIDKRTDLIPQYYNPRTEEFEAQRGESGASLITGIRSAWREDFPGVVLDPARWTVVQTGAGQTITVTASELRIATGVTPNAETIIRSIGTIRFPCRVMFMFMLSQRIAEQQFFLELTNATGDMLAQWRFEGTAATLGIPCVTHANTLGLVATHGISSTAGLTIVEIEALADEFLFHNRPGADVALSKTSFIRNRQCPDPNQDYFIQIRVRNLAVAPASTTTLTVDAVIVQDISAIAVEIVAGRGQNLIAQSVPVWPMGGTLSVLGTGNMQSINTAFADSSTPLGANAIFTGTSRDFTTTQRTNRFRAASTSDQVGTLFVEQSNDGTAWVMTHSQATASVTDADAVARHIANLDVPVVNRHVRVRYRNDATIQTAFRLISMQVGV